MTILLVTVGLVATGTVPVAVAFFGAAVLMILTGALPIREAYASMEWPILVMLGCSHSRVARRIRTTGGTDLIAAWLSSAAGSLPRAWCARAHHGRGDGGDAVPQQRRDRAGDGAHRRRASRRNWATGRTRS